LHIFGHRSVEKPIRERNDADDDFNDFYSDDENDRGQNGGASSSSSKSSSFLNAESAKRGGGFLLLLEIVVENKDDDFLVQKFSRGSAKALRKNFVKVVYYLVVVFLFEKKTHCNCRHLFV